ncbi:MAG: GHKL domain-containing protein [Phascolarctobacterium sp.]|nr:GHKL domain-containing protein [Phascolarctobacterium sp.]MBR6635928.1 GHKL domain-containing protein [Phascolarctobacterium sp.]
MWKKSKEANTESQVRNTNKYKNIRKYFTLSQKIVILITMVVFIALLPSALFTTQRVAQVIYDRVSINAVSINNILCNSDIIIDGLVKTDNSDDSLMASYVNEVDNSDEAGVAIYDKNFNLRVFYNPGKLADFKRSSLELTQKYSVQDKIDWRENYAIPNRAFGYVKDADDKIVGYVVTGYSDDVLKNSAIDSIIFLLIMTAFGLSVGILGAIYLARHVKKILFGLEPEAIAAMLQERNIILDSVREGVITIDDKGMITLVNIEAENLLKDASIVDTDVLVGKHIKDVLKNIQFDSILNEGRIITNAGVKLGDTLFIITSVPLMLNDKIIGAVFTFRKKSVVEELANQLTGFKNYSTALRAQTHEFMNKMHVIMGLIEMKAYDELKTFTKEVAYNRQSEVSYIVTRMKDITLAGFILGKISRSRELDIDFSLSDESELRNELEVPSVHDLVLIVGNIVENAFDALANFDGERIVSLSILDFDKEIVITVEDSGPGMDEEALKNIFTRGYSSKGKGHGYGLYLVKQSIDNLEGSIDVESVEGEGTTFTVRLPIKRDGEIND